MVLDMRCPRENCTHECKDRTALVKHLAKEHNAIICVRPGCNATFTGPHRSRSHAHHLRFKHLGLKYHCSICGEAW